MATVIRGDAARAARRATARPTELVVSITTEPRSGEDPGPVDGAAAPMARIDVAVRDEALARRITVSMTRAVRETTAAPPREVAVVRAPSRKALERLGARVSGAIAVVPVTARNLRRLVEIVAGLRAAGAAGVQLAWDGRDPAREVAEAKVFAVLEQARSQPGRAPVVLARGEEPVEALRILVDRRR
jgi:hypothetical protein